ncbi:MAG: TIGR01906 family membrane protein [Erysipelotrichales bacterium]|nr:TIGR01906 family membrane protein [Erysipelotrichales bacterium]
MKTLRSIMYTGILLLSLVSVLITVIEYRAYDLSYYEETYTELEIYEDIGISEEDLMNTTTVLLSYMQGKREDMVVYANIRGIDREVFNEKEKLHMIDVNALIHTGESIMYMGYALLIAMFGYLLYKRDRSEWVRVGKAGLVAIAMFIGVVGALLAYMLIDFNSFWTSFHHVFFTNDLWLLDPRTDVMIQMFPLEFFEKIVLQITFMYVGFLVIFALGCIYMSKERVSVKG